MKRISLILAALASSLLLTACPHNEYTVIIKPDGDGLNRTLQCQRSEVDENGKRKVLEFPEDELGALEALYTNHEVDQETQLHTFRGRVATSTPSDVGGAGYFFREETSMGSVSTYTERFRGEDDQWGQFQKRVKSADQFTDLLIGWFESELTEEPGFEQLREFLDQRFRHDLKNLSFLGQILPFGDDDADDDAMREYVARIELYLHERGYFSKEEASKLSRVFQGTAGDTEILELVGASIARRMGIPWIPSVNSLPAALDFLKDEERLAASLESYMLGTEFYRLELEAWKKENSGEPNAEPPNASEMFWELGINTFIDCDSIGTGSDTAELNVRLELPVTPIATNGEWDEESGAVIWEASIQANESGELPTLCHAAWSVPDEAFQKARFGKVLLTGESLKDYVLWRLGLSASHAEEWEAFLAKLTPGESLIPMLEGFRFSDEEAESESSAREGVTAIRMALEDEDEPN
ncbi:MAG: hypothetical protein ACI8UO_002850 [Verrucomicrobiales bacterium]|jgi:hypothetical protein